MSKTVLYISLFISLFIIIISTAMGDAFDQTVNEIISLEADLEQNQIEIEETNTFIEEELSTFRANHALNEPKGEFESDADYSARIGQLNGEVASQRSKLEKEHLSPLQISRQEILSEISSLYRRIFVTTDVTTTLGRYDANDEYFPITFEANNRRVDVKLYISRHNHAPILKQNWDKIVKKAYISIDPGYKRAIAYVGVEYLPLWENGRFWRRHEVYHFDNDNRAVAFSSDGKYIATGNNSGSVSILEVSSGKELRELKTGTTVYSVAFSPDGKYLATGDNSQVRLYRVDNGKQLWARESRFKPRFSFTTYLDDFYSVTFSPDGKYLATGLDRGKFVLYTNSGNKLWGFGRYYTPRFSVTTYYADVHSVAFSPDGKYLATGDTFDDAIIWNAQNGRRIRQIKHSNDVWDVDFRPDGQYLATGDNDGNVSICEVSSGTKIHVLPHSGGWVGAVGFSPDGKYLAVGRQNNRINIYRIPQGQLDIDTKITTVRTIYTIGSVYELAWHPSGSFISDGKKVYRTLHNIETVNLIPPDPTLQIPENDPANAGTQFTLDLTIDDAFDLAGWQLDITFDPAILSVAEVKEGNFLKTNGGSTFFQGGNIDNTTGKVSNISSAVLSGEGISGAGTLVSITFDAISAGDAKLQLINTTLSNSSGDSVPYEIMIDPVIIKEYLLSEDVNQDMVVNIQDLVIVASNFGQTGENKADVNGDGVVNIQDLVLVASAFGNSASAPALFSQATEMLSTTDIKQWLSQAQQLQLNLTDPASQRGILFLEQILAVLTPKKTSLLPNYPNPFNPETWIPYQLATPSDVTVSIYSVDGTLIRRLDLGHKPVGIYQHRSKAAHWDGNNTIGETVASGVYFYTFTAGEFTATRKMLIRK